jgi:hypothetical protein
MFFKLTEDCGARANVRALCGSGPDQERKRGTSLSTSSSDRHAGNGRGAPRQSYDNAAFRSPRLTEGSFSLRNRSGFLPLTICRGRCSSNGEVPIQGFPIKRQRCFLNRRRTIASPSIPRRISCSSAAPTPNSMACGIDRSMVNVDRATESIPLEAAARQASVSSIPSASHPTV